jgi:hypothetical protein
VEDEEEGVMAACEGSSKRGRMKKRGDGRVKGGRE